MILYEDGYTQLYYNPATGILYAPSPDLKREELLYVHKAFSIIVKTIINHDIRKLLLDASKSQTELCEEDYFVVMEQLVRDLLHTRLQKLARVVSENAMREKNASQFILNEGTLFPYEVRNFTSKAAAEQWLQSM